MKKQTTRSSGGRTGILVIRKSVLITHLVTFLLGFTVTSQVIEWSRAVKNNKSLHEPGTNTSDSSYSYQNNNIGLPPAETCTEDQRQKILHQLLFKDDANFNSKNKSHYGRFGEYFGFSRCPEATWINELYATSNNPDVTDTDNVVGDAFLGISIGCNKGFDAIKTARMGIADDVFDVTKWRNAAVFAQRVLVGRREVMNRL